MTKNDYWSLQTQNKMTCYDTSSILLLTKILSLSSILNRSSDFILQEVIDEALAKKSEVIACVKKKPRDYLMLNCCPFSEKNELIAAIEKQFDVISAISGKPHGVTQDEVRQLSGESRKAKLKCDSTESLCYLFCNKNGEEFVVDDIPAYLFFKAHPNCKTILRLLFESIVSRRPVNQMDILKDLYTLHYRSLENRHEIVSSKVESLKEQIDSLKRILSLGSPEMVI